MDCALIVPSNGAVDWTKDSNNDDFIFLRSFAAPTYGTIADAGAILLHRQSAEPMLLLFNATWTIGVTQGVGRANNKEELFFTKDRKLANFPNSNKTL